MALVRRKEAGEAWETAQAGINDVVVGDWPSDSDAVGNGEWGVFWETSTTTMMILAKNPEGVLYRLIIPLD